LKPLGPIPTGFETIDGELAIGGRKASELVGDAGGTPLFVYFADMVRRRVAHLRAVMPDRLHIHYAMKANPYRPILELMGTLVDGFDIASQGELAMALAAGLPANRISFAGPGKRDAELTAAIVAGVTLNLESENEARRALENGERHGVTPRLAIRVNADFGLRGSGMKMGGGA
jgi:diaminopimelate decarboxylase